MTHRLLIAITGRTVVTMTRKVKGKTGIMFTYARQYRRQRAVRQRLRNFCINKNELVV